MKNLTPKQLRLLTLIRDRRIARGYSPSLQELAEELGVSKVTVFEYVEALVRKGALSRQAHKARSLEVNPDFKLPDQESGARLPLVGTIAAGCPIDAVEDRQFFDLEAVFGSKTSTGGGQSGGRFVLKVRGDSMIEDQICDGDYVVIEGRNSARNGETVVALLENGEATLKRFYREAGHIRLQPANAQYQPIIVNDCRIQGIVVGVIRKY